MAGIIGYGTTLLVGATPAATTATVAIANLINIPPPGFTRDLIDVTSQSSPNATREFIAGLKEGSELTVKGLFIPGSPGDLVFQTMINEVDPRVCEIGFTQVTPTRKFTFRGLLISYEPSDELDDKLTVSIGFKVAGAVVAS